jgi:hypothetical protein
MKKTTIRADKKWVEPLVSRHGKDFLVAFWFDPLLFSGIAVISFTLAYFIHKIPWASKITG